MRVTWQLLAVGLLALAACDTGAGGVAPSGGAAGAQGAGYCDSPPSDMADMERWESLCMPGR